MCFKYIAFNVSDNLPAEYCRIKREGLSIYIQCLAIFRLLYFQFLEYFQRFQLFFPPWTSAEWDWFRLASLHFRVLLCSRMEEICHQYIDKFIKTILKRIACSTWIRNLMNSNKLKYWSFVSAKRSIDIEFEDPPDNVRQV